MGRRTARGGTTPTNANMSGRRRRQRRSDCCERCACLHQHCACLVCLLQPVTVEQLFASRHATCFASSLITSNRAQLNSHGQACVGVCAGGEGCSKS